MRRNEKQKSEPAETYELPQGVVVKQGGEEKTFRVLPSRSPGLVFIHIQVNTNDRRKYYQTIELDPTNAELVAEKIKAVSAEVKKQLPGTINNGSAGEERS